MSVRQHSMSLRLGPASSWRLARRAWLGATAGAIAFPGCSSSSAQPVDAPTAQGEPLEFTFAGVDGRAVSAEGLLGRVTVLLFMTTFDVASQAQARRLEDLSRLHAPRLNAIGVFVEAPRYAELAREFGQSLGLSYPLAMADPVLLAEHPQLRLVQAVPAWIFLDPEGYVRSSAVGALTPDQLEGQARQAAS